MNECWQIIGFSIFFSFENKSQQQQQQQKTERVSKAKRITSYTRKSLFC